MCLCVCFGFKPRYANLYRFAKLCVPENMLPLRRLIGIDEVLFAIGSNEMDPCLRATYAKIMRALYIGQPAAAEPLVSWLHPRPDVTAQRENGAPLEGARLYWHDTIQMLEQAIVPATSGAPQMGRQQSVGRTAVIPVQKRLFGHGAQSLNLRGHAQPSAGFDFLQNLLRCTVSLLLTHELDREQEELRKLESICQRQGAETRSERDSPSLLSTPSQHIKFSLVCSLNTGDTVRGSAPTGFEKPNPVSSCQ